MEKITKFAEHPVYCHVHHVYECNYVELMDDPDPKIRVPVAKCCHTPVAEGLLFCHWHKPAVNNG